MKFGYKFSSLSLSVLLVDGFLCFFQAWMIHAWVWLSQKPFSFFLFSAVVDIFQMWSISETLPALKVRTGSSIYGFLKGEFNGYVGKKGGEFNGWPRSSIMCKLRKEEFFFKIFKFLFLVCKQEILVDCPSCHFYHSGSKSFYLFLIINQNLNSSLSWYWACLICIYSHQLISYPSKLYTIMQNYFEVISYISWQKSI